MRLKKQKVANDNLQFTALKDKKLPKKITTKKNWNELNVDKTIKLQLRNLKNLITQLNIPAINNEVKHDTAQGYKILFAGSVKGKKLAAKLIGKQTSLDVYRIDLTGVAANYTSETEKSLKELFDAAKQKNWILFFDEADALFGKRTNIKDAHDRYANQEASFLFQQIKDYPGLIIFSSKNSEGSNDPFPVNFNTTIHFKKPL